MLPSQLSKRLLDDTKLADVDIVAGDKVFRAHRQILAGASSVLYTMLTSEMEEAKTGRIEIKAEAETVDLFKKYIYTQDVSIFMKASEFQLAELYHLSKFFEVEGLSQACSKMMTDNLELSNLLQSITVAGRFEDENLMKACLKLIEHKSKDLMCNEDWIWFISQNLWVCKALKHQLALSKQS